MSSVPSNSDFNRRDFLKSGSVATLMTMLGGVELIAQTNAPEAQATGPRVKLALIGLGSWGREILNNLGRLPQAEVAAICDTYPSSLRRSANAAPGATQLADYTAILANKDIKAVIVATPTHLHRDIVLAALKAGKHVYCEAPLANSVEDARTIAEAAKAVPYVGFQSGYQLRSDPQRHFLLPFIRSGALGQTVLARSQWHAKQSWRSASPNPEREKALNWRLDKSISPGLMGEISSHQMDQATWFLNALPTAVSGFGSLTFWKDGRDVPDTALAVLEFPGGVLMNCDATLVNSFDADYEMLYGSDAAIMLRESKAWMFKEVDSPLLGWEVYARKETFYKETGIALVANASKSVNQGDQPGGHEAPTNSALYYALDNFLRNTADLLAAADFYKSSYGEDDVDGLHEHLSKVPRRASAGFIEGFRATVMGLKANEAVLAGKRIELKPEWFELGQGQA